MQKQVNSRWRIVYRGSRLPATCYPSQWARGVEGWVGGTAAVIQWHYKHEVAPSTRCCRQINYGRHELSGSTMGRLRTLYVSNDATLGDYIRAKDCCYCVWSSLSWVVSVAVFYDVTISGICLRRFVSATRAVSRSCTHLLPEHVQCLELIACTWNEICG